MAWYDSLVSGASKAGEFLNSDAGKGLTSMAGLGLGAYSAYNQYSAMNEANDLALKNYNYNKSINDRNIAKENLAQDNMTDGFNSVFGDTNTKKKKLGDYYGTTNYSA